MKSFYAIFFTILFGLSYGGHSYANETTLDRQQSDKTSKKKTYGDDECNAVADRAGTQTKFLSKIKSVFRGGGDVKGKSDKEILSDQIDSFSAYDKVLSSYLGTFGKKLPISRKKVSKETEKLVRHLLDFMRALVSGKAKDSHRDLEDIIWKLRESSYFLNRFTEALNGRKSDELKSIASELRRPGQLLIELAKAAEACEHDKLDSVISEFQRKERKLLYDDFVNLSLTKAKELLDTNCNVLPFASQSLAERAKGCIDELIKQMNCQRGVEEFLNPFKKFAGEIVNGKGNIDGWKNNYKTPIEEETEKWLRDFCGYEADHMKVVLDKVKKSLEASEKFDKQGGAGLISDLDNLIKAIELVTPIIKIDSKSKDDAMKYVTPDLKGFISLLMRVANAHETANGIQDFISAFKEKDEGLLHNDFVYSTLAKAKDVLHEKYNLLSSASRPLAERLIVGIEGLIGRRKRMIQRQSVVEQLRNFEAKLLAGNMNIDEWDSHKKCIEGFISACLGDFDAREGCYVRKELVSIGEYLRSSEKMSRNITKLVQDLDDLIKTIDLIVPVIESVSDKNSFYVLGMRQSLKELGQRKDFLKNNKLAKEILKEINTKLGRYSDGSDEFWDLTSEFRKLIEEICGIEYVFGE